MWANLRESKTETQRKKQRQRKASSQREGTDRQTEDREPSSMVQLLVMVLPAYVASWSMELLEEQVGKRAQFSD